MKYRRFGNLGWESSVLAMGTMRLPGSTVAGNSSLAHGEAVRLIRRAIDQGVNYVDLGFPFDMKGHEPVFHAVREALRGGYREKVKLSMTVPALLIESSSDLDLYLNMQLRWLGADSVDFCLLGRLNRENWPRLRGFGALEWVDKASRDGRVGNVGFSFHDHYQTLRAILRDYEQWSLCQFQYSYMDIDHDPGVSGVSYAANQGLAVVVTEPLRGGRLTGPPPEAVGRVWAGSRRQWSLAEWGLRFVWNHPGVSTVVCDMSTTDQLEENLRIADVAEADSLTVEEEVLLSRVRETFRKERPVPCPSCRPCMPCPQGIDVPRLFEVYNDAVTYGDRETATSICRKEHLHPEDCVECRICESRCAKRLPIVAWVKRVGEALGTTR